MQRKDGKQWKLIAAHKSRARSGTKKLKEKGKIKMDSFKEYATRQVIIWLENTQRYYNYVNVLAEQAKEAAADQNEAAEILARDIEDFIKSDAPEVSGLYNDILTQALYIVDYYEVAEAFLDE